MLQLRTRFLFRKPTRSRNNSLSKGELFEKSGGKAEAAAAAPAA